jgi:two-component system chemotaxis sensor kinase CheA
MISLDDELATEYLAECREHLATIETDLLALEKGGAELSEERINRIFRAVHSIKGGAGFFDLVTIRDLAHGRKTCLR